jgi:hypothetical protein
MNDPWQRPTYNDFERVLLLGTLLPSLLFLLVTMATLLIALCIFTDQVMSAFPCHSNSSTLVSQDCVAFMLLFDYWQPTLPFCKQNKYDPCSCKFITCDKLAEIPKNTLDDLYISEIFLPHQRYNRAPSFPEEFKLFLDLHLARLFSDDIPSNRCIQNLEGTCISLPEQVGQVYFNLTEASAAIEGP